MAASVRYDYGVIDTTSETREGLRAEILTIHFTLPLRAARACGLSGGLLAFAGLTLAELLQKLLLDELVYDLGLDWSALRLLGFAPRMLANLARCPLVALYDAGMRREHLLEYTINGELLGSLLGELGAQLLRVELNCWGAKR